MSSAYIYNYLNEDGHKDVEGLRLRLSSLAASKGETIDDWVEHGSAGSGRRTLTTLIRRMSSGDSIYVEEVGRLGSSFSEVLSALCAAASRKVRVYGLNDGFTMDYWSMDPNSYAAALEQAGGIYSNFVSSRTRASLRRKREEGMSLGRPVGFCKKSSVLAQNRDEVALALRNGEKKADICRRYGVSPSTLYRFCAAEGLLTEERK